MKCTCTCARVRRAHSNACEAPEYSNIVINCLPVLLAALVAPAHRNAACRVFTGLKASCHQTVQLLPKGTARMRECLRITLECASPGIEVQADFESMKERCLAIYNKEILSKHQGASCNGNVALAMRSARPDMK
jgi:hypothetical protein